MLYCIMFAVFVVFFYLNIRRTVYEKRISWKKSTLWHLSQVVNLIIFLAIGHALAELLPESYEYFGIFFTGAAWLTTEHLLDILWSNPPRRDYVIDVTEDGKLKLITWTASEKVFSTPEEAYRHMHFGHTREQINSLFQAAAMSKDIRSGTFTAENIRSSFTETDGVSEDENSNQ